MSNTTDNQKVFDKWMAQLNKRLAPSRRRRASLIGFTTDDLAVHDVHRSVDQPYRCWFDDGYSINDAIAELAVEEGFTELLN